ncbi:hypothetical protein [Pedobacter miscanthi]|uniref:hypothetical protein n=1 Tax=Pedobacter miscanthi TaxID=2259170 RepID=UPI0011BE8765|nr:hypothetical protein [Pedobacter miscanthi]
MKVKQVPNCSIIGVVLLYLMISLGNIFLLSNLSLLEPVQGIKSATQNNGSFSPLGKDSKITRQFKCILDERKKNMLPVQEAVIIGVILLFCLSFLAPKLNRYSLERKSLTLGSVPIYISNQVFRI